MSDSIESCREGTCEACGEVAVHPMAGVCMECGYDETAEEVVDTE